MKTTTSIKLDKEVKKEATKLAGELGVSFSAVVNSMLKNFIRERRLVLSVEPELNEKTKKEYEKILRDIKAGRNLSPTFTSVTDLMKALQE
ncbi:MAG: type II toxin-antitoxin system RelB/DinJ family antitoxin [Candidatus Paceibacterota bacterium]